ncbi:hypothetical protein [Sporosarcina sp. Marseille-Q4943]|uniref:hypothetical protein n=1 Tax=Sporosarcina sp. Marseille-Q4943 TaxID=2942204 RepID=UPI00208DCB64|nr:hypothetical protein [Sporosarcina sp. Marseille-Q4943]
MINTMRKWFKLKNGVGWKRTFLLFAACLCTLAGCHPLQGAGNEKNVSYERNFEIIGPERDELIGNVNQALFNTVDRSNERIGESTAPIMSKDGKRFSLLSGRYLLHGYPVGNVFIYDKKGDLIIREIVGGSGGVRSLTMDIDKTYSIHVDGGYAAITAEPHPTMFSNELTAGIWEVGLDIEAGDYVVTSPWGLGYLEIHDKGEEPRLYEIIGGDGIKSESRVTLTDGQILRITKVSMVEFAPLDGRSDE